MLSQTKNPLTNYFRHPAIYLKLPSKGRWWDDNAIDLPENGEIPIMPMTAKDEIVLRTPDALMNGQGVIDVIQSCCPNIKNAWKMPSADVDAILISIRIASFGEMMEFESQCPHCNGKNSHEVSLGGVLSSVKCPDYSKKMQYKELKIQLKPQNYFEVNKSNIIQFEESKILNTLNSIEIEDTEKARIINESVKKLVDTGIELVASSTEYIELPDGERVFNTEHIHEFYNNAERELITELQSAVKEINDQTKLPSNELQCIECQKTYLVDVNFDYSNFFGKGF